MNLPWDAWTHIQNFFQLNFLFSGLEVSSFMLFIARLLALLVFGGGFLWLSFKTLMKALECLQALFAALAPVPRIFYLLLFLVAPLSSNSVAATWLGYILLVVGLVGVAMTAVLALVLWKYGVEQAMRFVNAFRSRSEERRGERGLRLTPPEEILRPDPTAHAVRTEAGHPA